MNIFVFGRGGLTSTMLPEICFVSGAARCPLLFSFPLAHDLCQLLCVQAFLGTLVSANNFGSRFYNVKGKNMSWQQKQKSEGKNKKSKNSKSRSRNKNTKKTIAANPGNPDAGHKYVLHA